MKKMKKAVALGLALTMVASMAACGNKDDKEAETTPTPAGSGSAAPTQTADTKHEITTENITIKFSWWGGDSRHEATQAAVNKFMEDYPNIKVEMQYGAWSGWEANMATAFSTGTAPDVNQVNWNWISSFSSDGKIFVDMNEYSDIFDLSQYSQSALDMCTVAGKLQAIPVSMTGRIFYWNKTTFEKAGISTPTSLEELYAAGETFKTVLGDDYYPLALGEYDRMILMVYYLESVYGKAWVVDNQLQYTQEEIEKGLEFIQSLEDKHVIPSIKTITGDGAESLDKNPKWMDGYYAGIFEWDSSASKFGKPLTENGQEFIVGDYFADFGQYQGGYSKVSLAFAISETSKYKAECALLLNYLLNENAGTTIMASERGIPLSTAAFNNCNSQGLLDSLVAEANQKVLAWVSYPLDPNFESSDLKSSTGVYYDVMAGLSYGDYSVSDAATALIEGINEVYGN